MSGWKTLLLTAAVLVAACDDAPQSASSTGESRSEPPTGRLGDKVVPTHYRLALTVVPERERFDGEVAIDVRIAEPHKTIWLHGNALEVSSVSLTTADGDEIAATYEQVHDTGVARVALDRKPPAGEATLTFDYTAPFNQSLEGLYKVVDAGESYAFTQFEATSARLAFPSFDEPAFKTPFDISVTAREGDTVITTTPEASREPAGDGLIKRVFETTEPLPTYLIAFAVGPLDVVEADPLPPTQVRDRAIPLRGIAAKGKGDRLGYALANTRGILESLEAYFGRPYPYAKLDIIAVPDFAAGAMENVGAITYRERLLLLGDGNDVSSRRKRIYARVHAHELAHQWFGNLVTPEWWNDIWLNEAFATWMGHKAIDDWRPNEGYGNLTLRGALGVMDNDAKVTARQIREPVRTNHDIASAFDGITYRKGGGVLEMFEAWLGEEAFRKGVRLHMERFAHQSADVNDFLESLADGAERPEMADAFRSFLFQPGVPLVTASAQCHADGASVTLTQKRYLPIGSNGERDKTWQIPVCAAYGSADGERQRFCRLLKAPKTTVDIPSDECPAWLLPNENGSGYYRFALDSDGWSSLLAHFSALNEREALALAGSMSAAYRSGDASTEALVNAFAQFAEADAREVATAPISDLWTLHDRLATTETAKRGVEAYTRKLYGERLATLGLEPRSDDDSETRLLRNDLIGALAELGRDPDLRRTLTDRAVAYLGEDERNTDAIPPGQIGTALRVAVAEKDRAFAERLLERALASRDATFRRRVISALAQAPQADIGTMMRGLITDDRLRDNEATQIFGAQRRTPEQRSALWDWTRENLDALLERTPTWRQGSIVHVGNGFCSEQRAQELKAFFADKVEDLEGAPRELAQTVEEVRLCAALKRAKSDEATAHFAARD